LAGKEVQKISNLGREHVGEVWSYEYNEQVNGHVNDGGADKHAQVLANVFDVEGEQIGQDQEEHSDGRQFDQEGDDLEDSTVSKSLCYHNT
jgi:hypothetical protein